MTYREYFQKHDDKNFSWCKPFTDGKEHWLVVHDGNMMILDSHTVHADSWDGSLTEDILEQFAREVNPDYDLYQGWCDAHIALEAMHEVGCLYCPFYEDCDAMDQQIGERDYL